MNPAAGDFKERLRAIALSHGYDLAGFSPLRLPEQDRNNLERFAREGYAAGMDWFVRHLDLRTDPARLFPGGESALVLGTYYRDQNMEAALAKSRRRVSRYAGGRDYHRLLRKKGKRLLEALREIDPGIDGRIVVDSAPVPEKILARMAGLGWQGKHTNLIHPEIGSYFFLSVLLLNRELPGDGPLPDLCGECRLCLDACPTGALFEEYKIDAARCISYLTIERDESVSIRSSLDTAVSAKAGEVLKYDDWVFGCDVCQEVCPYNRNRRSRDRSTREPAFLMRSEVGDFMAADDGQFERDAPVAAAASASDASPAFPEELFVGSPLGRAGAAKLRQNIAYVRRKKVKIKAKTDHLNLRPLHAWYGKSKRDLPFRRTRDVYPIWVSEVMLQQTRVAAMLPKYLEFTRRFPDLAALAAAPEAEVLAAWQGLGYYSRARNLRKGARYILEQHDGDFPSELSAALKVPGVGPYTAAAILSIALNQPTAVLDGNVKRVLDRLLGLTRAGRATDGKNSDGGENGDWAVSDAEYARQADRLIELRGRTTPGDHNQAMMELGAVICVPGRPDCAPCPLRSQCATYAEDPTGAIAAGLPPKKKKPDTVELRLDAMLIYNRKRTKLLAVREESSRFFRRLWFFPYRFSGAVYFEPAAAPGLEALLESDAIGEIRPLDRGFRHSITHHRIEGRVIRGRFSGPEKQALEILKAGATATGAASIEWRWVPLADLHATVVSSLARKIESIAAGE
ncbi:MAG: tRNA epoxyqueuosine(34) reductase QueG [bacterium]|nr:tRNA epoxyqueuosine(34) reductase QueG [bacterium]